MLKEIIDRDTTIKALNQKVEELTSELTANKTSSDSMNSITNELHQNREALVKSRHDDSTGNRKRRSPVK